MLITVQRHGGHLDVFLGKHWTLAHGWQRVLSWAGGARTKIITVLGWCISWTRMSGKQ